MNLKIIKIIFFRKKKERIENELPQGLNTHDHFFYSIVDDQIKEQIGILWFFLKEGWDRKIAFIADVKIFKKFQRKGFGTKAFKLMEGKVRELGIDKINLHVFSHNDPAIKMYEKLGYKVYSLNMTKIIKT